MKILEIILKELIRANALGLHVSRIVMSADTYDKLATGIKKLNVVGYINLVIHHKVHGLDIVVVPEMEGVRAE